MDKWQSQFLGIKRFPRELSGFVAVSRRKSPIVAWDCGVIGALGSSQQLYPLPSDRELFAPAQTQRPRAPVGSIGTVFVGRRPKSLQYDRSIGHITHDTKLATFEGRGLAMARAYSTNRLTDSREATRAEEAIDAGQALMRGTYSLVLVGAAQTVGP